MAAGTACGDAAVVHRRATFEAGGVFVAGFAGRCGDDVAAWFGFNRAEAAAVTGRTVAADASVVHGGRDEGRGVLMAGFAGAASREVRR